jgi:hypothetical protein
MRNGVAIPSAIGASYTLPSVLSSDTGALFTVQISNAAGSVLSNSATLTIGPRAPLAGDLRFQQVDSPATVNGYSGDLSLNMLPYETITSQEATGQPLSIGPGCQQGPGNPTLFYCGWVIETFNLPTGVTGLSAGYQNGDYSNFQSDLATITTATTVITGIDTEPAFNAYALSWTRSQSGYSFDMAAHVIDPNSAATAIASEGQHGRVVTAISWQSGNIYYLSYGWQGNTTTTYDTQLATATLTSLSSVATNLASAGYIITATGGTPSDGILLVGTKVSGDTMPRPIIVTPQGVSPAPAAQQGYASVGVVYTPTDAYVWWIAER